MLRTAACHVMSRHDVSDELLSQQLVLVGGEDARIQASQYFKLGDHLGTVSDLFEVMPVFCITSFE